MDNSGNANETELLLAIQSDPLKKFSNDAKNGW